MIRFVLSFLVACGGAAPNCPLPPKPAVSQPFLWKAQKGDGPVVWLYGTVHVLGIEGVHATALAAFDGAPTVMTELGDTEADPEKTSDLALLPSGKGLDQQLPANDWYDLRDALRGSIKEAQLARVQPWYAGSLLRRKFAPPPSPNMDFALATRARAKGKKVEALETWEVQLKGLNDFTVADLQGVIHVRHQLACSRDTIAALYTIGDLPSLTTVFVIPQTHALVAGRTKAWVPKVEALLAKGGGFVAVGLGHLAGEEGLPALLAKAGYTVARVP